MHDSRFIAAVPHNSSAPASSRYPVNANFVGGGGAHFVPIKLVNSYCVGFNAFRASSYPAHLSALLEIDLRRIAAECGWTDVSVDYTGRGRVPGTGRHWPASLSRLAPRAFSDNVLLVGCKPSVRT